MKICIVSPNLPRYFRRDDSAQVGGSEVQTAFLAGALAAVGQEVSAVVSSLRPDDRIPFPVIDAFDAGDGWPGFRFFHPRLSGIHRALAHADADVYYQRNASMLTGVTALFCRRHSRVFVYGSGSDTDFWFRAARMDNFRDRCLFYTGLKLADGVIVQNEAQKERFLERHNRPVRVIANGINVAGDAGDGDRDLVIWMGGLRRIKRPELFLELARRLPEQPFALLGGSVGVDQNFADRITEEAKTIDNLTHTGHLPHDRVREYLRRALVLVNTSRVEGFPNAYLEAWSSGVPVVTFNDVDGIVATEKLGTVCHDIDDMEKALRSVLSDREERLVVGARARAVVSGRFSAPVLGERYIEFFRELAGKTPATGRRSG